MYVILNYVSEWLMVIWAWSAVILQSIKRFRPDASGIMMKIIWVGYHELKSFYLPAVVTNAVTDIILRPHVFIVWRVVGIGAQVLVWYMWRNMDDDDRWKRRGKKIADIVKRAGSRLIVTAPRPTET